MACFDMSMNARNWNIPMKEGFLDNGGRRAGVDRRVFSYAVHIPERRMTMDRRLGIDRREQPRKSA
jgi:hypothetical protein